VNTIPVGILGASGYAGRELCALVAGHPRLSLAFAAAGTQAGQERTLLGGGTVRFVAAEDAPLASAELVFSALPHGASAPWVARAQSAGARVVDLSADHRPGNGVPGVDEAPYGLPELLRDGVRGARLVANPGCYATAVLVALAPLAARGLIARGATVSVCAASGVTGAGNSPRADLLFGEVAEDFRAYAVGNEHRHLAEMRAILADLGADADLLFTPHLLPVARGILATIAVPLAAPIAGDVLGPWRDHYADEPFVEIASQAPTLREVVRRNVVRIWATRATGVRTPTLIVVAAIDNLMKGAAGQAVQNANLMLGLDEVLGLPA